MERGFAMGGCGVLYIREIKVSGPARFSLPLGRCGMLTWNAEVRNMRLLVAEDDPKLLKTLVHIFEHNKFSVDGVSNGGDALTYYIISCST